MLFREIRGNEALKQQLVTMCDENRTGHAILFSEAGEYGAVAHAVALAQYLSCPNRSQGEPCGTCPSCQKFDKLIHPDLHFIFPVNATAKGGSRPLSQSFVAQWRELLLANPYFSEETLSKHLGLEEKSGTIPVQEAKEIISKMSIRSYEGGNKYAIIWLPERMTAEAANKLLKIIEEPYPNTYFFLITHAPERVISTIVSRCLRIEVGPIPPSSQSKGDESEWQEPALALLRHTANRDLVSLLQTGEGLWEFGREKQKYFCLYLEDCLRSLLYLVENVPLPTGISPEAEKHLRQMAPKFSREGLEKAFSATDHARTLLESNVNAKSVFAVLCNFLYNSVNL